MRISLSQCFSLSAWFLHNVYAKKLCSIIDGHYNFIGLKYLGINTVDHIQRLYSTLLTVCDSVVEVHVLGNLTSDVVPNSSFLLTRKGSQVYV